MHEGNLIHGDLTTSNILVKGGKGLHGKQEHCAAKGSNHSGGQRLCFIDFGLARQSSKAEDKAVDLLVFRKTFEATHVELMPEGWNLILEGYLENKGQKQVLAHMEKVEKRARYH